MSTFCWYYLCIFTSVKFWMNDHYLYLSIYLVRLRQTDWCGLQVNRKPVDPADSVETQQSQCGADAVCLSVCLWSRRSSWRHKEVFLWSFFWLRLEPAAVILGELGLSGDDVFVLLLPCRLRNLSSVSCCWASSSVWIKSNWRRKSAKKNKKQKQSETVDYK